MLRMLMQPVSLAYQKNLQQVKQALSNGNKTHLLAQVSSSFILHDSHIWIVCIYSSHIANIPTVCQLKPSQEWTYQSCPTSTLIHETLGCTQMSCCRVTFIYTHFSIICPTAWYFFNLNVKVLQVLTKIGHPACISNKEHPATGRRRAIFSFTMFVPHVGFLDTYDATAEPLLIFRKPETMTVLLSFRTLHEEWPPSHLPQHALLPAPVHWLLQEAPTPPATQCHWWHPGVLHGNAT